MTSYAMPALARRHPWLAASLLTHIVLAASLYTVGPVRIERRVDAGVRTQVAASLRQTARREMDKQVRAMAAIKTALEDSAGLAPTPPAANPSAAVDPVRQARALAAAIERVRQRIRAAEMARVLRIPEADALKRVRAEAARLPKPSPQPQPQPQLQGQARPPKAVVAQLAAQAKVALAERRAQLLAQREGVAVKGGAPGAGPQSAAHGKPGPGKGSGVGAANNTAHTGAQSAATGGRLDALAKGLDMAPYAITGSSMDMSGSAFSDARGYGAYRAPPPVDGGRARTGDGRMLGAGAPYANRIVLDTWYVIGPFEGQGRDSQQAVYPPERGVDLDAVYYGKNDLPVRWTWEQYADYPAVPRPRAENAVYFAYTEVEVERDMDVWVWIGADDDSKMWFNDSAVWLSSQLDDKAWYRQPFTSLHAALATRNLSEGQRRLHFHKGRNTILFKLYNGIDLMFFSVVLAPAG